jgi:acetyl/propionyl-CoA carboxylase alpha subunit
VSASYDSLVAKVMAHGQDRGQAVGRLSLALRALELDGLETNRDLLQAVLDDGSYREGAVDVHFLERRRDLRDAALPQAVRRRHAAAVAAALSAERSHCSLVPVPAAGWRNVGEPLHADKLSDALGTLEIRASAAQQPVRVLIEGQWQVVGTADVSPIKDGAVDLTTVDDDVRRRYRVRHTEHAASVNGPEGQSMFVLRTPDDPDERGGEAGECRAPLPGAVTKVLVSLGDVVAEGDGLVVLEAMKMEHALRADGAGTVSQVTCEPGQQVDVGDLLVAVEPG